MVISAESELLETHDKKSDKKKTQHLYSDMINRSRVKCMGDVIQDKVYDSAKAAFLRNDGSFAGANFGIQNCHAP